MVIAADTKEKRKFYSALGNIKIIVKIERKRRGRTISVRRREYVNFANQEVEYTKLINYFESIENKYQLARYCLQRISKECKNVSYEFKRSLIQRLSRKIIIKLIRREQEKQEVSPEFQMFSEYFIFTLSSSLDTMAHILNIVYGFGIPPRRVNISKIYEKMKRKRDVFSRCLLRDWKDWIDGFKKIRNEMTHHIIIRFSSRTSHGVRENELAYTRYGISITIDDKDLFKPLPKYFDEILSKYQKLSDEFYKKLNSVEFITN